MIHLQLSFRDASRAAALFFFAAVTGSSGVAATITGLGHLWRENYSRATGVSDDGTTVVGSGGAQAFRWTSAAGIVGLGDLLGGSFLSNAEAVSADGSIVVGWATSTNGQEAFRWTLSGGMVGLGDLTGSNFYSVGQGVSATGDIVVGYSNTDHTTNYMSAYRWTAGTGMQGIVRGDARGISADGTTIVGSSFAGGDQAFRWTSGGGAQLLGYLPGGVWSEAWATSSNGNVVVGYGSNGPNSYEAFRWTESTGLQGLGYLRPNDVASLARAVSGDGNTAVGFSGNALLNDTQAFLWNANGGTQNLHGILIGQGADVSYWQSLIEANDVSANGRWIAGAGVNKFGRIEAFLVDLGEPSSVPDRGSSALLLGLPLGICLVLLRRRLA
jgi:probable HAF family extracellular repeat protein